MKTALLAGAAFRALDYETRDDNADPIEAATRAVNELRAAVEAGDKTRATELKALQDRLDEIELRSKRPKGDPDPDDLDETSRLQKKAFGGFLRYGIERMPVDEQRSMIVGDDTKGGYLAPPDFVAEVIKGVLQYSPMRQAARVGSTTLGEVTLPRLTGRPTASWVGETETRTETESSYGQVNIPINEAACYIDVSLRLLEDSAINIEAEIAADLAEEFGRLEGEAFIVGDGLKKPYGILSTSAGLSYTPTGVAANIFDSTHNGADALIDMFYALAPAYRERAAWMMSGTTLAAVRKLKTIGDTETYLWQPPIAAGQPSTLLGRPVIEATDMNVIGANAYPIAFGDFNRGYRIYDKAALSIMRDPYTQATSGKVRFHARRRTGGTVVLSEAIRLLKCATS